MNMKSYQKILAAVICTVIISTACVQESEPLVQEEAVPIKEEIRVLYAGVEANIDSMKYAAEKYEAETDIKVVIESFPMSAMRDKLFSEVVTQKSYYDVYLVDMPWIARIAPDLLDLMPFVGDAAMTDLEELAIDDFIPSILAQCIYDQEEPSNPPMDYQLPDFIWQRPFDLDELDESRFELIGLPLHPNVLTLAYRKDYFDNPALKELFEEKYGRELKPPLDWSQFLETAQFFTRSYNPESPSEFGTTLMPRKHESLYCDWRTLARTFGVVELGPDMQPEFNTEAAKEATVFYNDLINVYHVTPTDVLAYTWDQVTDVFAAGGTAMAMNYHRMLLDPEIEKQGGEVGFALVPGKRQDDGTITRAPHQGSYILAINKYSNKSESAYDFILKVVSPEWQKEYSRYLFHSSRISYYNDPEVIATRPEYWPAFYESLQIGYERPRIVDYVEYSEIIQEEISSYFYGEQSIDEALDLAESSINDLLNTE